MKISNDLLLTIVIVIVVCLIFLIIDAIKGLRKAKNTVDNAIQYVSEQEYKDQMAEKDAQNLRDAEDDKR